MNQDMKLYSHDDSAKHKVVLEKMKIEDMQVSRQGDFKDTSYPIW